MIEAVLLVLSINTFMLGLLYSAAILHNRTYNEADYLEKITIKRFRRLFYFHKSDKNILKYCYQDQAVAICMLAFIIAISVLYLIMNQIITDTHAILEYYVIISVCCFPAAGMLSVVLGVTAYAKAYKKRKIDEKKKEKALKYSSRDFMQILQALTQTQTDMKAKEKAAQPTAKKHK